MHVRSTLAFQGCFSIGTQVRVTDCGRQAGTRDGTARHVTSHLLLVHYTTYQQALGLSDREGVVPGIQLALVHLGHVRVRYPVSPAILESCES